MPEKTDLIQNTLKIELEMFLSVPTDHPARCQDSPDGFKLARGSVFEAWSDATLEAYLEDLTRAQAAGRNLMTEKYARIDNRVPCMNMNPKIDDIVKIEAAWHKETQQKYPRLFAGPPAEGLHRTPFEVYLRSELETYSDKTIDSYFVDAMNAKGQGQNLVEEKFGRMFQKLGFRSLAEAEEAVKKKSG